MWDPPRPLRQVLTLTSRCPREAGLEHQLDEQHRRCLPCPQTTQGKRGLIWTKLQAWNEVNSTEMQRWQGRPRLSGPNDTSSGDHHCTLLDPAANGLVADPLPPASQKVISGCRAKDDPCHTQRKHASGGTDRQNGSPMSNCRKDNAWDPSTWRKWASATLVRERAHHERSSSSSPSCCPCELLGPPWPSAKWLSAELFSACSCGLWAKSWPPTQIWTSSAFALECSGHRCWAPAWTCRAPH